MSQNVAQGNSRRRLLGRARSEAPAVRADDRPLLSVAPGLEGGLGQRLVQLAEARRTVRIAHVPQQHVVHALKVLGLRRPAPIAPDDLARKALRAEDLVTQDLRVVAGLGIDVHDQAALWRQQASRDRYPVSELGQIVVKTVPTIVERWQHAPHDVTTLAIPFSLDARVLSPGQEGRIEIDQGERGPDAFREGLHHHQVVAVHQHRARIAGFLELELRRAGRIERAFTRPLEAHKTAHFRLEMIARAGELGPTSIPCRLA